MPKTRGKKRPERTRYPLDSASPDEADSESVCSSHEDSTASEDPGSLGGGVKEEGSEEDVYFLLSENIDRLADKSSRSRCAALEGLLSLLRAKIVSQHLQENKLTLIDIIIRGLKRTKGKERCDLLQLVSLLVIQFGLEHPEVLGSLRAPLLLLAQDPSAPVAERSGSLSALGLCTFIQGSDAVETEATMHELESLFSCRMEPVVAAAVQSWTLLLSILPPSTILPLISSLLPTLNGLLSCADVTVRIAAGQAIALLFELSSDSDSDEELLETSEGATSHELIQQQATESNRYTARKERNQQRASFRDILLTLEEGTAPSRDVKFGLEQLVLDSWAKLIRYDTFRDLLGSGLKAHLQMNELLRDIFQLGPVALTTVDTKASRLERKYYNAAVAKYRTQSRGKQRDKRAIL